MMQWIGGFLLGLGLGLNLIGFLFVDTVHLSPGAVRKMVVQCEKNLPRTEQCTVIAVPKKAAHAKR